MNNMPMDTDEQNIQSLPVLAAHMQHLVEAVKGVQIDLKEMPVKMAAAYVTAGEFATFKADFAEVKKKIDDLSRKMDERDSNFVTQEFLEKCHYVTRDQFAPFRTALIFIGGTLVSGLVGLIFWGVQRFIS